MEHKTTPPFSLRDTEETRRWTAPLHLLQWLTLGCLLILGITLALTGRFEFLPTVAAIAGLTAVSIWLNRHGRTFAGGMLFLLTLLAGTTWQLQNANGVHDVTLLAYMAIITFASLLLDRRGFVGFMLLVLACLAWLVFGEMSGAFRTPYSGVTDAADFILVGAILTLSAAAVRWMADQLQASLHTTRLELAELRETQNALDQTQRLLAAINDNSSAVIFVKDLEGIYLLVNRQFEQIYGITKAQVIGHTDFDFQPREIADPLRRNDAEVVATGRTMTYEETVRQTDGERTYISIKFPLFDANGKLYAVAGMATDISERMRVEDALRLSEEKFSRAFRTSPDSVNINRMVDGAFVEINQGFTDLMGYSVEEVSGKTSLELDVWADPQDRAALVAGLRERGEVHNLEARFRRKNGEIGVGLMSATIIDIRGEKCILSVTRDITERKRTEDEVRRLNVELEQRVAERTAQLEYANRELESFAFSVSHDLRAPLRAITGYAKIFAEEDRERLDADGLERLERILANTRRMDNLIEDLLVFSRLSRKPVDTLTVGTRALVTQVIEEIRAANAGREIDWRIGDLPDCLADPSLLRQVFANLIENGVKFTRGRTPARIEIGCRDEAGQTVFFVRDNGAGFDMRYADKLFGVFQRLHSERDFEGTGIGLATVQRIVHRHGGRVWAEGRVNEGATFSFTLG